MYFKNNLDIFLENCHSKEILEHIDNYKEALKYNLQLANNHLNMALKLDPNNIYLNVIFNFNNNLIIMALYY